MKMIKENIQPIYFYFHKDGMYCGYGYTPLIDIYVSIGVKNSVGEVNKIITQSINRRLVDETHN